MRGLRYWVPFGLALLLGGCSWLTTKPPERLMAHIDVRVGADRRTVVLDGRGSTGEIREWWWDLDDGLGLRQGDPVMYARYDPGVYVVRLRVVGVPSPTLEGTTEPGTPPWLGDAASGTLAESWDVAVVDLASTNRPVPIIYMLQFGRPISENAWTGYITFDGTRSIDRVGRGLTYRWEIERLDTLTGDVVELVTLSDQPTFTVWLRGAWCEANHPYLYRIRLRVMDGLMQEAQREELLWVW